MRITCYNADMKRKAPHRREVIAATVTERGQVTIPARIRRLLGVDRGKVHFVVEDGEVHLQKPQFTIETAAGSVTPINRPEDIEAMIQTAKDERAERTELKTWAAKQLVLDMARGLLTAFRSTGPVEGSTYDGVFRPLVMKTLPFNVDSDMSGRGSARDAGFFMNPSLMPTRPLLELCAFVGLQRFRPTVVPRENLFLYSLWPIPLLPSVAAAVASGTVEIAGTRRYEFRLLKRTEYMKAFLPAQPCRGDAR